MAAERGEDDGLLAGLLRLERLAHRECDGVRGLRCRDDALGARELHGSREALGLRNGNGFHHPELVDVRDERRHAVVAQATCVNRVGDEVVTQRVHLHKRGHACGVAEVVAVLATGERRAGSRLGRDDAWVDLAGHLLAHEREGKSAEVRAATGAADDVSRGIAGHLELQ